MNKLIFISFCLVSFISVSEKQKREYEDASIKCSYEQSQGRLDGNYVSYYKNGKKKSEGKFENNYRIGKWTVWDSTGRIRMQREYSDPFTLKRLIPEVPKENPIELLNAPQYTLHYNKDSCIDYFKLKERMVVWSKRLWRTILPNENPILFEKNKLFAMLNKNIFNKNITPFQVTDDEFRTELLVTGIDTSSIKVIGYKIKEDSFFDNERLVFESRIIGICPVVVNKIKGDTLDFYWVYFPEVRKYLAQEKIQQTGLPSKIKTLDDLFFYRYFYGQIYKESNVYDRQISAYKTGKAVESEAERIEISLIENEHDLWISFTQ